MKSLSKIRRGVHGQKREGLKLFQLAKFGETDALQALLRKVPQIDLNPRDEEEWTPLCWAVFNGNLETAKTLVQAGGWVNVKDEQGRSPLYFASGWGGEAGESGEFAQFLLDSSADADVLTHDDWSPLYLCAFRGRMKPAEILLRSGADILLPDTQGRTPYDIALVCKHPEIAEKIKERGQELLREYAGQGEVKQISTLMEKLPDLDINGVCPDGLTALHCAMREGQDRAVKLLVDLGADPFIKTKEDRTPHDYAIEQGNLVLLKLYCKFYAQKDIQIELPTSTVILRSSSNATLSSPSHPRTPESDRKVKRLSIRKAMRKELGMRKFNSSMSIKPPPRVSSGDISRRTHFPQREMDVDFGKQVASTLTGTEIKIARQDARLCGLLKQLTEDQEDSSYTFSNLAYGTFLSHQEDLLHRLESVSNVASSTSDLSSILRSIGIRTSEEIYEWADRFTEPVKMPKTREDSLVMGYLKMAEDTEQLDEIEIRPELAGEYIRFMSEEDSQLPSPRAQKGLRQILDGLVQLRLNKEAAITSKRTRTPESIRRGLHLSPREDNILTSESENKS